MDLPNRASTTQLFAMQHRYLSRYFCRLQWHAGSSVQEPPGKLSYQQSFCHHHLVRWRLAHCRNSKSTYNALAITVHLFLVLIGPFACWFPISRPRFAGNTCRLSRRSRSRAGYSKATNRLELEIREWQVPCLASERCSSYRVLTRN